MIESEFITWDAPDGHNPARTASQRSYDAVGRKAKDEWLALFAEHAVVEDPVGPSFFDQEGKGHVATFTTHMADGTLADTDLVTIYRLDEAGLIESMRAYWEVDRTLASLRKP